MTEVTCGACGQPILDESSSIDPGDRRPCPQCGSTVRSFTMQVSGGVQLSGAATFSVTRKLVELQITGHPPTVVVSAPPAKLEASFTEHPSLADELAARTQESAAETTLLPDLPDVLLQATILRLGDRTAEGQLVAGVAVPWFELISQLKQDPAFLYKINWRKLEELIAGAYERDGWPEVVLTPRSGDLGRDIIATKPGVGCIRILDQIKAYHPGHLVTADEVRAMAGVLDLEHNVSKGFVTTTSAFAPGIEKDLLLQRVIPYRLELKDGAKLLDWLTALSSKKH